MATRRFLEELETALIPIITRETAPERVERGLQLDFFVSAIGQYRAGRQPPARGSSSVRSSNSA